MRQHARLYEDAIIRATAVAIRTHLHWIGIYTYMSVYMYIRIHMYVLQAKLRSQQLTYTLEAILSTQFIFSKKKRYGRSAAAHRARSYIVRETRTRLPVRIPDGVCRATLLLCASLLRSYAGTVSLSGAPNRGSLTGKVLIAKTCVS